MAVKPIPDGFHTVTPYLVVHSVAALLDFLQRAFDAQQLLSPMVRADGSIGHAEVKIGDSVIMMGEPMGDMPLMPGSIYLYVNDADAVYQRALQAGATSLMEPADQFYGDRSGGVKDAVGNQWWIATHKEDVPPDEMLKRAKAAGLQPR
jgi:PhnB protein